MKNTIKTYIHKLRIMLSQVDPEEIELVAQCIWNAYTNKKTVYIIGNGGSATTASHMACDLSKSTSFGDKPRLNVVSLVDNVAVLTAIGNDMSYDDIFVEQLKNRCKSGDVLIALSVSGTSKNVVNAVTWATDHGMYTISFVGRDGGTLRLISNMSVLFPDNDYGPVEDGHLIFFHILVEYFKEKIKNS